MKTTLIAMLCILLTTVSSIAQNSQSNQALILIDIQEFYFPGGDMALVEPEKAAENAAKLLGDFRQQDKLIIHVRHAYEPGGSIYSSLKPLENEKVITKSEVNAFLNTELLAYLKENNIDSLVLCGMQTHMCLEAATRAAHDFGFDCTVIADACATRDLKFNDLVVKAADVQTATLSTLNRNYAKIITTEEFLK